ncbi:MAG: DUF2029 domain-containing protein [Chloroflexia bacterium]|nr:DUF2029 domain-containing protein [Chloroflexia bacterium]
MDRSIFAVRTLKSVFEASRRRVATGSLGAGSLIARVTALPTLAITFCFVLFFLLMVNVDIVRNEGATAAGSGSPLGGDFIAFFNAGRIVADGDGSDLYDWERQVAGQARALGVATVDTVMPFPYPAFVAAPYALLARMPYVWAYVLATLAMFAAAIAAVLLLRPVSPTVRAQPLLVTLGVLASQPLLQVMYGGQTVAFSLLCFAGSYAALRRERDVAAGVWLGLLLYKPQLAVPLLALLLWRGRWRVVAVAGAVGIALGSVGLAIAGPDWPRQMLALVGSTGYTAQERLNGPQMISLMGVAEQIFGAKSLWAYAVAGVLGLGALALLLRVWRHAKPERATFSLQFGLAIVVTLLVSPHALYYEAGLLVLPAIALIDHWRFADTETGGERPTPFQRLTLVVLFLVGHVRFFVPAGAVDLFAVFPIVLGVLLWQALVSGDDATATAPERWALTRSARQAPPGLVVPDRP